MMQTKVCKTLDHCSKSRSADFFCKQPDCKLLLALWVVASAGTTQLCYYSAKAGADNTLTNLAVFQSNFIQTGGEPDPAHGPVGQPLVQ